MSEVKIILAALWVCLMLTYLLGDVFRIFNGDFKPGEMAGKKATQSFWLLAAVIMLIPIIMVLLSLILPYDINRAINIIVAIFLALFNLSGLNGYPGLYDRFLIIVGIIFNLITIVYAIQWSL